MEVLQDPICLLESSVTIENSNIVRAEGRVKLREVPARLFLLDIETSLSLARPSPSSSAPSSSARPPSSAKLTSSDMLLWVQSLGKEKFEDSYTPEGLLTKWLLSFDDIL